MPGFLREPSTQNCMLDQLVKRKKTGNEYLFFCFVMELFCLWKETFVDLESSIAGGGMELRPQASMMLTLL